jgi:plastocyanin/uncharacterized membrane protein
VLCRKLLRRVPLIAALLLSSAALAQPGSTHIVIMKQMHIDPPVLTVQAGDTVEWRNEDIFAHTATADDKKFDSGLLQPGQSWRMTFLNAGDIAYHCTPHPNMRAKIVVTSDSSQAEHANQTSLASESIRFRIPNSPEELHPILVNFTAALLPLAFLSDLLGLAFKRQSLHHAAAWMVLYEALLTPLTVAAGWWWRHQSGGNLPHNLITVHQWLGTTAALLFIILASWRWRIHKRGASPGIAYLLLAAAAVAALTYQGSLGGAMVFGK